MTVAGIEAVIVLAATLVLVVTRPRGLNEGVAALLGAAVILVLGLVPLNQVVQVEFQKWNIFLFFLGMMAIAALADQSGVFDVVAHAVARAARGRVSLLFLGIFALGAVISLLFANDSTALVLTPIVYALVLRLSLDPLPFVFVTIFIADTASIGLPVSNPLNVIMAANFHLQLGSYVGRLWLPTVLVVAINIAVFSVLFRRILPARFAPLPAPTERPGLRSTFVLLAALAAAYLIASAIQFRLGVVAIAGAAALALNLKRTGLLNGKRFRSDISYAILAFIAGMLIVVRALDNAGVASALGRGLAQLGNGSTLASIAVSVTGTALGSNLINNLPMALVMVPSLHHVAPAIRQDMVYATILGCDLGPNLTHLGSLATFLWLFFLRRQGLKISAWEYFKLGAVVTPALLAGAILGLWMTSGPRL